MDEMSVFLGSQKQRVDKIRTLVHAATTGHESSLERLEVNKLPILWELLNYIDMLEKTRRPHAKT